MSKMMLASQVLAEWVKTYTVKEESLLFGLIEELKRAVVTVTMLQVSIDDADDEKSLQGVNVALIHALRNMTNLYEEVADQIVPTSQKGGAE